MIDIGKVVWASAFGSLYASTADQYMMGNGRLELTAEQAAACDDVATRAAGLALEAYSRRLQASYDVAKAREAFGG